MKDLRDPTALGERLIEERLNGWNVGGKPAPLSLIYDHVPIYVSDYKCDDGPLEKYGDPRLIPSTMPNAME